MDELKKAMAALVERHEKIRQFAGYADDVYKALEDEMVKSDEVTVRQFLAECNPNEFELSGYGFLEAARKFGLPFVKYIEALADEKGWTDYLKDMIGEARTEVE